MSEMDKEEIRVILGIDNYDNEITSLLGDDREYDLTECVQKLLNKLVIKDSATKASPMYTNRLMRQIEIVFDGFSKLTKDVKFDEEMKVKEKSPSNLMRIFLDKGKIPDPYKLGFHSDYVNELEKFIKNFDKENAPNLGNIPVLKETQFKQSKVNKHKEKYSKGNRNEGKNTNQMMTVKEVVLESNPPKQSVTTVDVEEIFNEGNIETFQVARVPNEERSNHVGKDKKGSRSVYYNEKKNKGQYKADEYVYTESTQPSGKFNPFAKRNSNQNYNENSYKDQTNYRSKKNK